MKKYCKNAKDVRQTLILNKYPILFLKSPSSAHTAIYNNQNVQILQMFERIDTPKIDYCKQ